MTTDRFKDGVQWWMDTTKPMSLGLYPNPPQWHIDTGNLVRLVPQRPWAGLADGELMECTVFKHFDYDPPYIDKDGAKHVGSDEVSLRATYENINAKLKEKNA